MGERVRIKYFVGAKQIVGKWSKKVTESSNALDLEKGVFSFEDPKKIAASLKRSAEQVKGAKEYHINRQ